MNNQKLFLSILLSAFYIGLIAQPDADKPTTEKDIVHLDDVIITFSQCVGNDCVNGENFGFDTQRLKENNLRIHFDDTSTSASFPRNDWRIQINDSSNGGSSYFGIEDATGGRSPFRIIAGAPSNSLWVDAQGDVGIGVGNPVVELHVVDGDSPTLRLEQDGSSGFTPQTWDVAGNETNFFVRDVTNGSKLPFRIRPAAPESSIEMDANVVTINDDQRDLDFRVESDTDGNALFIDGATGSIGIGTGTPSGKLMILNTEDALTTGNNGGSELIIEDTGPLIQFKAADNNIAGFFFNEGTDNDGGQFRYQYNTATSAGSYQFRSGAAEVFRIASNGDITFMAAATHASDKRLKSDVKPLEIGLKEILQLNPVTYRFNNKLKVPNKDMQTGLIAQELQEIIPELVQNFEHVDIDETGNESKTNEYLAIRQSEIPFYLINAIKDQQSIIQNQETRLESIEKENEELKALVLELKDSFDKLSVHSLELEAKDKFYLGQNNPNPFNGTTQISYSVPKMTNSASIQIFDLRGQLIKEETISSAGNGIINLEAINLPNGTYTYTLLVDNKMVATNKMVLAK